MNVYLFIYLFGEYLFIYFVIHFIYLFIFLYFSFFIYLFYIIEKLQIVIVSSQISLLCVCAEALSCLIWPFEWPYVYIPLLPHNLIDYVDAPTPFIMGIHSSFISQLPTTNDVKKKIIQIKETITNNNNENKILNQINK